MLSATSESASGAIADDDECSICLQLLYDPIVTNCGHHFCARCWEHLARTATSEMSVPRCPSCRTECPDKPRQDATRSDALRSHHPEEWQLRHDLNLAEARMTQRFLLGAEREVAEAAAEVLEADEQRSADGHRTIRMTAGLLRRHAREQSTYRTITLISKLELALCGLRDISPAIHDYSFLTSLRLEHNALRSLENLRLPALRILSVHHNQLRELGDAMRDLPQVISLDVSANQLTKLDGVEHCEQLTTLLAPHNRLEGASALAALASCGALSTLEVGSNGLDELSHLAPLSALAGLRSLKLAGNPIASAGHSASRSRTEVLSVVPQVRLLDGAPNAELQRTERLATLAARQRSLSTSHKAMMERKRIAMERRQREESERHSAETSEAEAAAAEAEAEASAAEAEGAVAAGLGFVLAATSKAKVAPTSPKAMAAAREATAAGHAPSPPAQNVAGCKDGASANAHSGCYVPITSAPAAPANMPDAQKANMATPKANMATSKANMGDVPNANMAIPKANMGDEPKEAFGSVESCSGESSAVYKSKRTWAPPPPRALANPAQNSDQAKPVLDPHSFDEDRLDSHRCASMGATEETPPIVEGELWKGPLASEVARLDAEHAGASEGSTDDTDDVDEARMATTKDEEAAAAPTPATTLNSGAAPPPGPTGSVGIYCPRLLPEGDRDMSTHWQLSWTSAADALLAETARLNRFRFEDVSRDLRAKLRDAQNRRGAGCADALGWELSSRQAKLLTADQCRLRWAQLDRALCLGELG